MKVLHLRSCRDTVGGLVYFGRMLDKIKLHDQGKLPPDYHENLGIGFDGRCCSFLHIKYVDLVERVKHGGSDDEVLAWCFAHGRRPSEEEIEIWNDYMSKRGWRDAASARLAQRLKEYGIAHRTDVQTFFDLIDVDEGHPLGGAKQQP
jgi:gluconokinase